MKIFDEATVASQLGSLLLSRIVLLSKTAQTQFIPYILFPREGPSTEENGLFSTENFRKFIIPKLLDIFCVRDAQIRLLLLEHFNHYMNCFSKDELQNHILPELLVGIKDTNDHLVAVTLRTLADLISILGSDVVIGGKRAKLFNDGRPKTHVYKKYRRNSKRNKEVNSEEVSVQNFIGRVENSRLPERPSPDGEEGETSTEDIEASVDEELENWEDWDLNEDVTPNTQSTNTFSDTISEMNLGELKLENELTLEIDEKKECEVKNLEDIITNRALNQESKEFKIQSVTNQENNHSVVNKIETTKAQSLDNQISCNSKTQVIISNKILLPDILKLDIKNQKTESSKIEDFDFFHDMEPVIETSSKYLIAETQDDEKKRTRLDLSAKYMENEDGWGDEDW